MIKHIIDILLFLFCTAVSLQGQVYESRKLAEIGELFPKSCLPGNDSIFNCPQVIHGKSLIVNYNNKHEIKHLGISLFSPETKEMINLPVCNFIERMMLELTLQRSMKDIVSKLQQYRINLTKNGIEFSRGYFTSLSRTLDVIQNPVQFSIQKDSCYIAYWEYGNNEVLSISFPVSRELIFGTDKKESDQMSSELFSNCDCDADVSEISTENVSDLLLQDNSDLYVRKGHIYLADKINSDTYYQRSGNKYQLIFSSEYPAESLVNLLITKPEKSLMLKITHRVYGGFTPEFSIPLSQLFCLFNEGFTTYCIYNRTDSDKVQVSAVLCNNDFGYIHLLRIKTTIGQLFTDNGIITADLYTNIPQHNLKNLLTNY